MGSKYPPFERIACTHLKPGDRKRFPGGDIPT